MARHGENIRKRTDGRWEGRYKTFDGKKNKDIHRSVYGRTYEEVKEKLTTQKNLLCRNPQQTGKENLPVPALLFSQAAEMWFQKIVGKCKHSTYIKYETIYRKHLSVPFASCPVTEIDSAAMQRVSFAHLSESQQKSIYCVANQILNYAGKQSCISMPKLKRQTQKGRKKPLEALSKAEQSRLFDVLYHKTDKYKAAVILSLYTGMRLGELCALKWSDIDLEHMTVSVNRTVQRIAVDDATSKTALIETSPKSDYSKRELPLSSAVWQILTAFKNGQPYILGAAKPLEPRTMQYRFKKILGEAKIADKSFHILRHTFATNCIEGGADVKSLSEILGHSDVRITLNRYVHPTMEAKRKQLEHLKCFYGQIYGQAS